MHGENIYEALLQLVVYFIYFKFCRCIYMGKYKKDSLLQKIIKLIGFEYLYLYIQDN